MNGRDTINDALSLLDPRDAPAVALLGHDLRAAVSEVIGGLRLIDATTLPAEPRLQIARTRAAAEAMALLLEQALMLLLADNPSIVENTAPLRTEHLIQDITLRWTARAAQNGQSFVLIASEDLPPLLGIEAALIERVLSNLLGNALKYAGPGQITCTLSLTQPQALSICVQDEGPGFADLRHLFSTQARPRNSDVPGLGLGLQIVKEMVERVGGEIRAGNRPTGGAEITVQLPLADTTSHSAPNLRNETADLRGLRLLVADDNETSRLLLSSLLTNIGAEVVCVPDGYQALKRIETETFSALLIDVEMPGLNGLKVIRRTRKMASPTALIPILAVTAYQLRANKQAIFAAGADEILPKPIVEAGLLGETILRVILAKTQIEAAPRAAATTQIEPDSFEKLLQMAGPAVATELINRLLADLQSVERGLLAASHAPNWPAIRAQSHILIALAGTAGAPKLHQLAQALNSLAQQIAPDKGTFRTLLPQTLESLDALIHFVGQKSYQPEDSA